MVSVMDTMQLIETKKAEVGKRVAKLRSQLESAEVELRNLEITADTLARLNLNPAVETAVPRGQSFNHVFGVLGETEEDAKSPKEIHDALVADAITSISQENVRTILSRYKERLESSDGKYWRKVALAKPLSAEEIFEILGGDDPQTENEPTSASAVGSDADHNSVRTGVVITSSTPSWPQVTS